MAAADRGATLPRKFMICFGAQRGGTTWLSSQLRRMPEFDFPPRKEIRYLDPLYVHSFGTIREERINEFRRKIHKQFGQGAKPLQPMQVREVRWNAEYALVTRDEYSDEWYASLFSECDPERWTGDFSPDYSLLPEQGIEHLARLAPDARLLFMMRDPVDRALSGASYVLRHHGAMPREESVQRIANLARTKLQLDFSDYRSILSRYWRLFSRERILVCFHDDIDSHPQAIFEALFRFLDLDPARLSERTIETSQAINRSPAVEIPTELRADIAALMLPELEWLAETFGGHAIRWHAEADALVRARATRG